MFKWFWTIFSLGASDAKEFPQKQTVTYLYETNANDSNTIKDKIITSILLVIVNDRYKKILKRNA